MRIIKLTDKQSQIVEDNHNLIYGFAHKKGLDINEWYGQLALELCRAVYYWNEDRGSLSTYYYMRAETMLMLDHQRRNYQKRVANEDVSELNLDILYDDSDKINERIILDEIKKLGDSRVIQMRYEGYSQEEIATELGVTQPTISRMLDKTLEEYKNNRE